MRKRKSYNSTKQQQKKLPNTSVKEEPGKIVKKEAECADIDEDVSIVHVKVEPISIDQLEIKENSYVPLVEVKTEPLGDEYWRELGVSEKAVGLYDGREVKQELVSGENPAQPELEWGWQLSTVWPDGASIAACQATKMSQESLSINNFFTDLEGKKDKAKCNLCDKIVSYKRNHLKNWHVKEYYSGVELQNSYSACSSESDSPDSGSDSPDSESDSPDSSASYSPPRKLTKRPATLKKSATRTYDQIQATKCLPVMSDDPETLTAEKTDAINKKLLKLFENQYLSVSLLDTPEFKEFVEELNPSYKLPSQKILSSVFIEKEGAKTELELAEHVALSTDWYSDENELHIDVTAHYVNQDADLKTYALESIQCEYNDRYIVENLAEKLRKTCENYELSNKIVAIVTDNDYNMKAAVLLNQWRHIPCLAQTLNNIILHAFDKIKVIHKKIKGIIKFLKQSSKRKRLISNQSKLKEPVQMLKLDVDTRWQTTCALFERVLAMRNSLQKTLGEYPNEDNLTNEDLNVLQGVTEILGIFKDVTKELCSGRTITIGEIIYTANTLKHKCTEYILHADWPDLARKFVRYIQKELVERYPDLDTDPFFIESTLLDPRFKKNSFPDKANCDLACVYLKDSAGETQDTKTYGKVMKREKGQSHLEFMKKREVSFASEVQREMNSFFVDPLLQISENPMKWWLSRKDQYPRLYALAWPRLFIPAMSVPLEQIFVRTAVV